MSFLKLLKEELEQLVEYTDESYARNVGEKLLAELTQYPKDLDIWFVHCGTDCTCCNNEDHYQGPYETEEKADKAIEEFIRTKKLASQYAPNGRYSKRKEKGQLSVDGSICYENHRFDEFIKLYGPEIKEL